MYFQHRLTGLGFCARKHDHENAKKVMRKLYGGIPDYDIDYEYSVILQNVKHAEAIQAIQMDATLKQIFVGTNGYVYPLFQVYLC
jgi:hypothetical protein